MHWFNYGINCECSITFWSYKMVYFPSKLSSHSCFIWEGCSLSIPEAISSICGPSGSEPEASMGGLADTIAVSTSYLMYLSYDLSLWMKALILVPLGRRRAPSLSPAKFNLLLLPRVYSRSIIDGISYVTTTKHLWKKFTPEQ